MKASLITLLPVACFMQGALTAPAAAVAESEARSMVGPPSLTPAIAERDLVDRGLLSGLLGLPNIGPVPDVLDVPELGNLNTLVTQVVNVVRSIDDTISGSNGRNLTTLIPAVTDKLTLLKTTLVGLQAALEGVDTTALTATQLLGIGTLLNRVVNAITTLIAQLTTVLARGVPNGGLDPITALLNQLLTSLGSILNLSILNGKPKGS